MHQGLTGCPRQESHDNIPIGHVRKFVVVLGEAPDVLSQGLPFPLLTIFEILGVPGAYIGALEVADERFP